MGDRFHPAALTLAATLLATGCDSESVSGPEPTLSSIQDEIFTPRCTQASCHSVEFHAGELVLLEGMTLGELAQMPANEAAIDDGLELLVPGQPESSFLWLKLQPDLDPRYGDLMPQGSSQGLPEQDLQAIREWIELGAPAD